MSHFLLVLAALGLVLLNGAFVAAEFGLVKLRATQVAGLVSRGGWRARILSKVHADLDTYLSACQLGITLASLGLGWIGEPAFAEAISPLLRWLGLPSEAAVAATSFVIAFVLISYLHIVLGELAPKSIALRRPLLVSGWTAWALYGFYWLTLPAIKLLNLSANATLKLAGVGAPGHSDVEYSSSELKLILKRGRVSKHLTRDEHNVLAHSMDFGTLEVSDLMRPIGEVVALSAGLTPAQNMDVVRRNRFSRYPYFDAEGERVLGMIHLKDLFFAAKDGKPIDDLAQYLRPAPYVPPRTPALQLFRQFRSGAPHFAVVGQSDALGSSKPVGFITLDNLLSALVGEIRDEFGAHGDDWIYLEDGCLRGKGSLPVFKLERALGIELPHTDADSVGGLIIEHLSELPKQGQRVELDGFSLEVERMDGPRIVTVRVVPQVGTLPDGHGSAQDGT